MKLYHRTRNAEEVMREGFKDSRGQFLTVHEWTGVWFSDRPLYSDEGGEGDTILEIEIPFDAVRKYLWKEQDKPYREFVIPAKLANRYGPPRIIQN